MSWLEFFDVVLYIFAVAILGLGILWLLVSMSAVFDDKQEQDFYDND